MDFQSSPSTNGYHNKPENAPPSQSGAFQFASTEPAPPPPPVVEPPRTRFPEELNEHSWRSLLYLFSRSDVIGFRSVRVVSVAWVLLTVWWGAAAMPGAWWVATLFGGVLVGFWVLLFQQRRTDFTHFVASQPPTPSAHLLATNQKVAIYVTGELNVQGKHRRFTWLPGFYRTFGTREHALIGQARERRLFLIAGWPEPEVGLWYQFIDPQSIQRIQVGDLYFARQPKPTIAIDFMMSLPTKNEDAPPRLVPQRLFIVPEAADDLALILADLAVDAPTMAVM